MSLWTKIATGQDLSRRMAEKLDVDLPTALDASGHDGAVALRGIALRCASCAHHANCARLMAGNETLDTPPDYCLNRAQLRELQRK